VSDPVSWLQIEQGWNVVTADGSPIGEVVQVAGDKQDDIFDGLAVKSDQSEQIRYVPGEQVAAIFPGEVTLKITAAEAATLEPYSESPPETTFRPQKAPLGARISSWLRGRR
jgi:hypothetical protein